MFNGITKCFMYDVFMMKSLACRICLKSFYNVSVLARRTKDERTTRLTDKTRDFVKWVPIIESRTCK